ncbi:DUF6531 domain-containing protein [Hahella ganghwensis]|uniref:DUF6531 domain-containing protein n=1 Tax=Hahella ganghwensis TaxID=286420 RepID=UPI000370C502|nr:DUF6531 domain-containing protein [Hahella ganghwensis]
MAKCENFVGKLFVKKRWVIGLSLLLSAGTTFAERVEVVPLGPQLGEFFKYREQHSDFQKAIDVYQRHLDETHVLLTKVKKESPEALGDRSTVTQLLESKAVELTAFVKELRHQETSVDGSDFLLPSSSLDNKAEFLSILVSKLVSAQSQGEKEQAIEVLGNHLAEAFTIPDRQPEFGYRTASDPDGISSLPIRPTFIDMEAGQLDVDRPASDPAGYTVKRDILEAEKNNAFSWLADIAGFFVPDVFAGTDAAPEVNPGVQGCYSDATDYANNGSNDLNLLQPELEVSPTLNPRAYQKITELAAQLEYSPVKIFEYVANNIRHEHYAGSVKGALGALESGGANDIDHASLMLALLRASSIPARYVRGNIYLQDKEEHLDWWNVRTLEAAYDAIAAANVPLQKLTKVDGAFPFSEVDGRRAFGVNHVWVEACVPYANYRGEGSSAEGHEWIALDPSYKQYERQDGVTHNVNFNYGDYLSYRSDKGPLEVFEEQIAEDIRGTDPNLSLNDVGVTWTQQLIELEFLPNSLPYVVQGYPSWGSGINSSSSWKLPDNWRAKGQFSFFGKSFSIPMTKFTQSRVTLSFVGASSGSAKKYKDFINGSAALDCGESNISVLPEVKVDGKKLAGLSFPSKRICNEDGDFNKFDLEASVRIEALSSKVVSATPPGASALTFDNISPLNYYALSAYAFNATNEYVQLREQRLLENLNQYSKPSDNPDELVGEFLNLVLLKYMGMLEDSFSRIGKLYGATGRSGHHIGVVSTRADVTAAGSHPYALQSNNFVIDAPGGLVIGRDIDTGGPNFDALRMSGYQGSYYETYVWQIMALKDAISTVTGIQIAREQGNEVRTFTSKSGLLNFVKECTAVPDMSKWYLDSELSEGHLGDGTPVRTVRYDEDKWIRQARNGGLFHDKDNLILEAIRSSINNAWIEHIGRPLDGEEGLLDMVMKPIETKVKNETIEYCYRLSDIDLILSYFGPEYESGKVILPKKPVTYREWTGPLFIGERLKSDGTSLFSFPISSYSGGYTVKTKDPFKYSPPVNSGSNNSGSNSWSKSFSSGYKTFSTTKYSSTSSSSGATTDTGISNLGPSPHGAVAGDPVNMVTGNMYHQETDFAVPTRGLPILLQRTYNSNSSVDGPFGRGWTFSYNQTLKFVDTDENGKSDSIIWKNGTGAEKYIDLVGSIEKVSGVLNITRSKVKIPKGFYFNLERPYSGGTVSQILITDKNGVRYYFENVKGNHGDIAKLTKIIDPSGHQLTFTYFGQKLTKIKDPDNRTVTFNYYSGSNHIRTISLDWANTVYEYFYTASGNLKVYRNPLDREKKVNSTRYTYYSASDGTNLAHRMKTFAYANGSKMTFEYYVNGKAYRHYNALGEAMTFTYNDFRRESTTVDEKGHIQKYVFNEYGQPVEITDAMGGKEFYYYEDANDPILRTRVVDPLGYETRYSYDRKGNLVSQSLPSGQKVTYSYFTNSGKPQLIRNALGHYRMVRYNNSGKPVNIVVFKAGFGATVNPLTFNPESNSSHILSWTHNEYDNNGKLVRSRQVKDFADSDTGPYTTFDYTDDQNGTEGVVPTVVSYFGDVDGDGVISSGEGLGTHRTEYDTLGRVVKGVNGAFYPVSYVYDKAGRLVEGTDTLGGTRIFRYDASGLPVSQSLMAHQGGRVSLVDNTITRYNEVNRKIQTADASGAISHYQYDPAGNLTKVTSPDGYSVNFKYDEKNRLTETFDEEGNTVTRKLDLIGRVRQLIDPNGNVTQYTYYGPEQNGKVKRITDAEGRWTEFEYNAVGQVTKVTDNSGQETLSDYDALGRVTRVVGPVYTDIVLGNVRPVTTYQYNSLGFQTAVYAGYTSADGNQASDSLSLQARYQYDDFGRLLKKEDALGKVWEITKYDEHGNILSSRDPNGNVTTSTYSFGGILAGTSTSGPAGTEETIFLRNGMGQPEYIESNNVAYSYEYDAAHRVKKVTDNRGGKSVSYDYSIGGLLNSITDNAGNKTSYLYDPVGRLTGIRTPDKGLISYVYDAGGRLQQKVFPNDLVTAYDYFKDNKVKSIATTDGSGNELIRQNYDYDNAGRTSNADFMLQGVTQSRGYEYDGLGRLIKERDAANDVDLDLINYDPFGNRRQRTHGGTTQYYSHNNLHQITQVRQGSPTGNVVASFDYDNNGNMVSKISSGTTTTLGYDALDRVVRIQKTGLPTELYAYDSGTRRISKTVGSDVVNYHYSGPDIVAEYGANWSTPKAVYAHGAAMDDPLVRFAANDPQYYHGDGLGSVVAMSNRTGTLSATNRYDAWGNVTQNTGNTPQYGYTGREPNANGMVYFRARFYDPEFGRFTQTDPKGFIDGVNQYAYVMNSPMDYVDPWGMSANRSSYNSDNAGIIGSLGAAMFENVSELGSRGTSGSALDNLIGTGKALFNMAMDMGESSSPFLMLANSVTGYQSPRFHIADNQLGGAAAVDVLSVFALPARAGAFSRVTKWSGSGPAPGVLGLHASSTSAAAVRNYIPKKGGIEFVFNYKTSTFAVGKLKYGGGKGSPHQQVANTIDGNRSNTVGGIFRRDSDGRISTDESSGHFGEYWTDDIRKQFVDFMNGRGLEINHSNTYQ